MPAHPSCIQPLCTALDSSLWINDHVDQYIRTQHVYSFKTAYSFLHSLCFITRRSLVFDAMRKYAWCLLERTHTRVRQLYVSASPICRRTEGAGLKSCPNFTVCNSSGPQWAFDMNGGLCSACSMCLGPLLFTQPGADSNVCPICLGDGGERVQMTCGANHNVCTACFRQPLAVAPYPTQFSFGCPKFKPGTACQLEIVAVWKRLHPEQYNSFLTSLKSFGTHDDQRARVRKTALMRCPVCRGGSPWNGENATREISVAWAATS